MPGYTFKLRDGDGLIEDADGVVLRDRDCALEYAHGVVQELLKGCEQKTRSWRLDVYEDRTTHVFAIPFATLDHTLDLWRPEIRKTIEVNAERQRNLREALYAVRTTLRESRALIALSQGRPYLAAERGQRTIR